MGIFGLVSSEAAELHVDTSAGESQQLDLYDLGDSHETQAFVGFVPEAETYELVERDRDGETVSEWTEENTGR